MSLKWGAIKVPKHVLETVDLIAKSEGLARHKVVEKAIAIYKAELEKSKRNDTHLRYRSARFYHPRAFYHAFKLVLAYGDLRAMVRYRDRFSNEELMKTLASVEYCLYRLQKDTKIISPEEVEKLLDLIQRYIKTPQGRLLRDINDFIREIVYRSLGGM